MKKNSIALIGFMGTGKTIVGKALADYLGNNYEFIETDQLVIEIAGKSIPRIFSEDGEEKFRNYEIAACKKASQLKRAVISCGGGIVLNKINIENLKKNSYIVLLKATIEEIHRRIIKEGKERRPLINKEDPNQEIKQILAYREPFYNSSAEIIVDTTGKAIDEIVKEIIKNINL
ncbi:MAG: shikimate kinase [Promethearchaeota archaeon]